MSVKIEMKDPVDLRVHHARKHLGFNEPDNDAWNAFVDGISGAGIHGIPPIFITADGQVMDGKRRHQAARQLGWSEIACIVRPEEDCAVLMIESLMGQRNLQRCVKVYIAVTILKEFVASAEHRRLRNIKNGVKTLEKPLSSNLTKPSGRPADPNGLRALSEKFGVSYETVRRAQDVYQLFSKEAAIKAEWEPKLLSGDKNLWNVLSAVGGAGADQSRRNSGVEQSQLEFWTNPWTELKNAAPAWTKLNEDQRESVLAGWRNAAKKLPQDLRDGMREVLDSLDSEATRRAA